MDLHSVLITVIAFAAVISVLSFVFHLILSPVKENQSRLEVGQTELRADIKRLEAGQVELKADIKQLLARK